MIPHRAESAREVAVLKILALSRNSNPYQEFLYGEIRHAGHDVRYAGQLAPLHTLNLLLLPLEMAACRAAGWRVLHVRWVFAFQIPGSGRLPRLRNKGVEDLLQAVSRIPSSVAIRLLVVGECRDSDLRERLRVLAKRCGERAQLRLEPAALVWHEHRVDEDDLRRQMYAYGKSLSAYLTKYVLSRHTCLDMLRRLPDGLRHLRVLGARSGEAVAVSRLDRRLMLAELCGLFMGPGSYVFARREQDRRNLSKVAP